MSFVTILYNVQAPVTWERGIVTVSVDTATLAWITRLQSTPTLSYSARGGHADAISSPSADSTV